ncbi:hypothetical protein HispidOSU_011427, partial [Sigmodon hispidus]
MTGLLGERAAGCAESCVLGPARGRECRDAVQLFHQFIPSAVVFPKSWGTLRQPVLQSFWNKAYWKTDVQDSHSGTSQLFAHFLFSDHRLRHLFLCYECTVLPTHLQSVHKPSVLPLTVIRHQDVLEDLSSS